MTALRILAASDKDRRRSPLQLLTLTGLLPGVILPVARVATNIG